MVNKPKTREEFLAWQEENQKQAQLMLNQVTEEVLGIFTPDCYMDFLRYMTKFNQYSYLNLVHFYSLCPHATYIAGFKTWKSFAAKIDPRLKVLKDEAIGNGLAALVPFTKETLKKDTDPIYALTYNVIRLYDISQINPLIAQAQQTLDEIVGEKCYYPLLSDISFFLTLIRRITGYSVYVDDKAEFLPNQNASICSVPKIKSIILKDGLSVSEQQAALFPVLVDLELEDDVSFEKESDKLLVRESCIYSLYKFYGLEEAAALYTFSFITSYQKYSPEYLKTLLYRIQSIFHSIVIRIDAIYNEVYQSYINVSEPDLNGLPF